MRTLANGYGIDTAVKNQDGLMAALAFSIKDANSRVMPRQWATR